METICENSSWELVYLLRSRGHLEDHVSMAAIHSYLLACCRRIWDLLPDQGSREGIVIGEKYVRGQVSRNRLNDADWYSESSAFRFDYYKSTDSTISEYIERVCNNKKELERLLVPPSSIVDGNELELLKNAAYFANYALNYPWIHFGKAHKSSMQKMGLFMPIDLFYKMIPQNLIELVSKTA